MVKASFLEFSFYTLLLSALIVYGFISVFYPKRIIKYEIRHFNWYPKWLSWLTRFSLNEINKKYYFYVVIIRGILLVFAGLLGLFMIYMNLCNCK